jgi:hypothetical protein
LTCHIAPSSVELCRFRASIWGRIRFGEKSILSLVPVLKTGEDEDEDEDDED